MWSHMTPRKLIITPYSPSVSPMNVTGDELDCIAERLHEALALLFSSHSFSLAKRLLISRPQMLCSQGAAAESLAVIWSSAVEVLHFDYF